MMTSFTNDQKTYIAPEDSVSLGNAMITLEALKTGSATSSAKRMPAPFLGDQFTGVSPSTAPGGPAPLPGTVPSQELTDFQALNYIASHGDLITNIGTDIEAAKSHYKNYGKA